ncbi:MAG: hypothetical protein H7096_06540 [Flavobacterium sp.]|nr:hypothetical protein [Pedobacter sp.]
MKNALLVILGFLAFTSFKKEIKTPEEEITSPDEVHKVLKDNSRFNNVFNVVKGLSLATGICPSIQVADFSFETINNFNIVYYSKATSQQLVLTNYYLETSNSSILTKVCSPFSITFLNNSGSRIIRSFLKPRQPAQGASMAFTIGPESKVVSGYNYNKQTLLAVTQLKPEGVKQSGAFFTMRHYRADGKILEISLKDQPLKKYWTFSYNSTKKLLTKELKNITLKYSGDSIDLDLDELGNIYYSKYALNGTNKVGVSIYKNSLESPTTRIDADDFLKFSTILKLKVLMEKIYLVLNSRKTGFGGYQFSVLRQ